MIKNFHHSLFQPSHLVFDVLKLSRLSLILGRPLLDGFHIHVWVSGSGGLPESSLCTERSRGGDYEPGLENICFHKLGGVAGIPATVEG